MKPNAKPNYNQNQHTQRPFQYQSTNKPQAPD